MNTTPKVLPTFDRSSVGIHGALNERQSAARRLLDRLKADGYRFTTPSLNTHERVCRRPGMTVAKDLVDVFGWSLPFSRDLLPAPYLADLQAAGGVRETEAGLESALSVASLDDELFLHSAYPRSAPDAVFFGPDTYRFARLLRAELSGVQAANLVDVGTGAGPGAVVAAKLCGARHVTCLDINPRALDLAAVNLNAAGIEARLLQGEGLAPLTEPADLIIANPPFIAGTTGRTYRDGGDMRGARVSLDWALASARRLAPQGRLILYTGSAIVRGEDGLRRALEAELGFAGFKVRYEEIDPDIFGEQLSQPGYEDVDRIAAVGAVISRS